MQNFNRLRDEIGEWAEENFTGQPSEYPLMGCDEERGELNTAILKTLQGIDDSPKYQGRVGDEAEKDAIGDIFVYLMNWAHSEHVDVSRIDVAFEYDDEIDAWADTLQKYANLVKFRSYPHRVEYCTNQFIRALKGMAQVLGHTLEECIETAWGEVQNREWDSAFN